MYTNKVMRKAARKTRVITSGIDVIFSSKEKEQKVLKGRNSEGLKGVSELVKEIEILAFFVTHLKMSDFTSNPIKHVFCFKHIHTLTVILRMSTISPLLSIKSINK